MNPSALSTPPRPEYQTQGLDEISYRTLNRAALMALVVGILSLLGFILATLIVLSLVGIALAFTGLRQVRKYPQEYSGAGLSAAGLVLSIFTLLAATGYHAYVYATEVPEGFERITFYELQPAEEQRSLPFSARAAELDGQKVFVKGYVYPEDNFGEVQKFVLVPDLGTCCFGGQPKLTDMIEVTLDEPLRVNYSRRQRKLAGVLTVDQRLKPIDGLQGVYFRLQASYVK